MAADLFRLHHRQPQKDARLQFLLDGGEHHSATLVGQEVGYEEKKHLAQHGGNCAGGHSLIKNPNTHMHKARVCPPLGGNSFKCLL